MKIGKAWNLVSRHKRALSAFFWRISGKSLKLAGRGIRFTVSLAGKIARDYRETSGMSDPPSPLLPSGQAELPTPLPEFTDFEKQGAVWMKLSAHLNARLALLRRQNDDDKDEIKTARLRGRIAEVQMILGLANKKPPAPQEVWND